VSKPFSGKEEVSLPTKFLIDYNKVGKIVEGIAYTAPGDKPTKKPTADYPKESLTRLPERLTELIAPIKDQQKASEVFRNYLKEHEQELKKQWKDLNLAAMTGDREAQAETGVILDYALNIRIIPELAMIFDPNLNEENIVPPATEEGALIYDQIWAWDW